MAVIFTMVLQLLAFLFILFALLLALFTSYLLYLRRIKFGHLPGPSPSSFFKGNFPDIQAKLDCGSSSFQFLLDCHLEHGDIVLIWLFFLPWVNVLNVADVRDVLIAKNFPKNPRFYKDCLQTLFGQRAMGTSLLTNLDEQQWRHRRTLMNPAFQRHYLRHLVTMFNQSMDIFLSKLHDSVAEGTEVKMADEFSLATLDVICKAGFGIDLDVINDPNGPFLEAYNLILKGVEEAFVNPLHKWDFTSYARQRKVIAALQFLRRTGQETIEKRREAIRRGEVTPTDLLAHILKSADGESEITEEDLIDDFVTFFSSGHETTSSTLSFCLLELAHNEKALVRLEHEVVSVLGTRDDVTYDDLAKFKFLGCCLKETLRLYPPAPGIIRITPDDVILAGYSIPKGTTVSASPFVIGRHPRYWDSPTEFLPERWESKEESPNSALTFFPFSLGPRNCIGQTFAIMESKVILARFIQQFSFALLPGQTKRIQERGSLQPMDGVVCKLTQKNG